MTLPLGYVVLYYDLRVIVKLPKMLFSVFSLLRITRLNDMVVTLNDHVLVYLVDSVCTYPFISVVEFQCSSSRGRAAILISCCLWQCGIVAISPAPETPSVELVLA